jgi:hypothetical protein
MTCQIFRVSRVGSTTAVCLSPLIPVLTAASTASCEKAHGAKGLTCRRLRRWPCATQRPKQPVILARGKAVWPINGHSPWLVGYPCRAAYGVRPELAIAPSSRAFSASLILGTARLQRIFTYGHCKKMLGAARPKAMTRRRVGANRRTVFRWGEL